MLHSIQAGLQEARARQATTNLVWKHLHKLKYVELIYPPASFLSGLAARNPSWMSFRAADFFSEEGRTFPYVYLSSPSNVSAVGGDTGKLRVWIQGSVHGNEPAGDEATLALLGAMDANTTWAASFLEAMDIIVLPRYNPDGNACKSNRRSCA